MGNKIPVTGRHGTFEIDPADYPHLRFSDGTSAQRSPVEIPEIPGAAGHCSQISREEAFKFFSKDH